MLTSFRVYRLSKHLNCGLLPLIHKEYINLNQRFEHIKNVNTQHKQLFRLFNMNSVLNKYNKKASEEIDSDEENESEFKDERDSKVVKTKVNSLRADLLLKSGLAMARNKVETVFYDSKIRVNGVKLQKKSLQLNVGDEIDVIKGYSQTNTSHLIISRVIILSANQKADGIAVNLRRYKSLLIDNYEGGNAYKSSQVHEH